MKTLDEVIKAMDHVEFCCTNCKLQFDCDEVECYLEDALYYLKAYRDDRDDLTALRAYWAEMHKDVRQKAEVTDDRTTD